MQPYQWTTCYYLAEAILDEMRKRDFSAGDNFGLGEDCLVAELLDYGEVLAQVSDELGEQQDFPGVFDYEVSNTKAAELWWQLAPQTTDSCGISFDLPPMDAWKIECRVLVQNWINEGNFNFKHGTGRWKSA